MEIKLNKQCLQLPMNEIKVQELHSIIYSNFGLSSNEYYLISNGRKPSNEHISGTINVIPRILGGKGGFGSMLRAIGAQIEKTTNREACRDLSGRRLRDINEEQRLKKWVTQQADREKEAKEKKKKKLEKMLEKPKYVFKDEEYDKERSGLSEMIEDAVTKGLEASCSGINKRKTNEINKVEPKKKKPKLWIDEEFGSTDSENEESDEDDHKIGDDDAEKTKSANKLSSSLNVHKDAELEKIETTIK